MSTIKSQVLGQLLVGGGVASSVAAAIGAPPDSVRRILNELKNEGLAKKDWTTGLWGPTTDATDQFEVSYEGDVVDTDTVALTDPEPTDREVEDAPVSMVVDTCSTCGGEGTLPQDTSDDPGDGEAVAVVCAQCGGDGMVPATPEASDNPTPVFADDDPEPEGL